MTTAGVPGVDLLDRVAKFLRRFLVVKESQLYVMAVWIVHTHCFEAAETTPYLSIASAEKRCGKTRVLELMELLVKSSWLTAGLSAAALVRTAEEEKPTLLLDESDAAFNGPSEYSETLCGIINGGYKRSGRYSCCVGKSHKVKHFPTFCPKAIAGIGKLPDTIADRSIPIRLQRKRPEQAEKFHPKDVKPQVKGLLREIEEWSKQNLANRNRSRRRFGPRSLAGGYPRHLQPEAYRQERCPATSPGQDFKPRTGCRFVGR
jgi:hypothetical protein